LDGVCYDFGDALRRWLVKKERDYGVAETATYPDPTRWEFYEDWGFTLEEFIAECDEAVDAGFLFDKGAPFPGTYVAFQRLLNAGHEIIIITDRSFGKDGASERNTLNWLDRYELEYHELYFTSNKTSVNVDYMIDDKTSNYLDMLEAGVTAYLMDRPWNQGVIGAKRVKNLNDYVDKVLAATAPAGFVDGTRLIDELEEVRVTSSTGGQKGKKLARFDLLPPEALRQVAELYGKGAEKYDDHNWRRGYDWSLSFGAMMRHAWAFWNGEEIDPETGCPHLTSVIFHALSLLTFMDEQRGFDDRFATRQSKGLATPGEGDTPPEPCKPVTEPLRPPTGGIFTLPDVTCGPSGCSMCRPIGKDCL
jgi:hypothetical protein